MTDVAGVDVVRIGRARRVGAAAIGPCRPLDRMGGMAAVCSDLLRGSLHIRFCSILGIFISVGS